METRVSDARAHARRLLAWLRYAADVLGWPGLLGLGLGGAAALFWLSVVLPLATGNAERREHIEALQALVAARQAAEPAPADAAQPLASLPDGHALLPLVAAVHAGADRQGIALDSGEYVWQRASAQRPASYRMSFPARGRYADLRCWTAALLVAHPELTLDEFNLRREDIGAETLESRVQFSVQVEDPA